MTTHLITGGAGFIGSALARRLLSTGIAVRVLDDASRGQPRRLADLGADLEFIAGDIRDPGTVQRACAGIDAIWHLAAVNGTALFYSIPAQVLEVGIKGMLNVLDAARRTGVGRLFLASSSEVYSTPSEIPTPESVALSIPDPLNPRYSYACSKVASELLALNYGRSGFSQVVVFRPHNVYGPDMGWEHVIPELAVRMCSLAQRGPGRLRVPIEGTGQETRAFAFIDDVVDALLLLNERGEHLGIYHVGTDVETRILDLVSMLGRYFGREVEIVSGELKRGGPARRCPDIAKIRSLGYAPRTSLEEGLRRTVPWYVEHASEVPSAVGGTR